MNPLSEVWDHDILSEYRYLLIYAIHGRNTVLTIYLHCPAMRVLVLGLALSLQCEGELSH